MSEGNWTPCYHCDTKIAEGNIFYGSKGSRLEAFCDSGCIYDAGYVDTESFESTPYNNYYGACMTSEGDCFETSLETCRAIGGRFQGPGTSCGGYQPPVMMRSETTKTKGKGNGVWLAITVGVMTGVATTIFGNVLSEMWLDRLREDPELHTTPDDLDGPV